jgi:CHAD domain-containing protein
MATRVAARDRSEDIAAIRETAEAARGRVANWPLRDGMAPLASGLQRIHRRARRAHRVADADPTPENLHELRKRTKDLRYAAQVLGIRKLDKDADKLSDVLGLDHDVVQLLDVSHRYPHALTPTDRELFERLIETRRAELQREALGRARKLYATKPGKVARLVA